LKKEYIWRLRMILKIELHAKNKITAIGALDDPFLRYTFGVINWTLQEITRTDRETRKVLQCTKCITHKLVQKRKVGGRGLIQTEATYEVEIINTEE
jgi:hypothetical protein